MGYIVKHSTQNKPSIHSKGPFTGTPTYWNFPDSETKKGCAIFRSLRGFLLRPSFSALSRVNP